jgi:hypothetical protein
MLKMRHHSIEELYSDFTPSVTAYSSKAIKVVSLKVEPRRIREMQ